MSEILIRLPQAGGSIESYTLRAPILPRNERPAVFRSRVAFAAAHVVIDPLLTEDPISAPRIDFDATLAYRQHLWSLGFGVAEAMDTAQRGGGLDYPLAKELIRRSCRDAVAGGQLIACGANTDQLDPRATPTLDEVIRAYEEQCGFIEWCGGRIILMASRALARAARSPADYRKVYSRILSQTAQPVILHWLGEAFDPALVGYWGGASVSECMGACLQIVEECRRSIDGIKISLLDRQLEIDMRRRLPQGVRMYTGDDFHYSDLIEGDAHGYSDALLGIFDPIAPVASLAFQAMDAGNSEQYRSWMQPTLPLSRRMFQPPTFHYKTGVVFLAYLNGHQEHFHMLGGQQSARSILHLSAIFQLADQARLFVDPECATQRMQKILSLAGVS